MTSNTFTAEAQLMIQNLQGAVGSPARQPRTVSFKAGSAVVASNPDDDLGDDDRDDYGDDDGFDEEEEDGEEE